MGSRKLLWALLLLVFTDHGQGAPETPAESLVLNESTNASAVGELLTTANPVNIPRRRARLCNCDGGRRIIKGMGREIMNQHCNCQPSGMRKGKDKTWKTWCQRNKNKNRKVCRCGGGPKMNANCRSFGPSVPI